MPLSQSLLKSFLHRAAGMQRTGIQATRLAIALVLIWIGGLKFYKYEADGIVPFVANSPLMRFFYNTPEDYADHLNKEGELNLANRRWHEQNNTYVFSYGLGILLVGMGLLLLGNAIHPGAGVAGSLLTMLLSLGTLTFLISTPESWVPALGDADYGFPFLSGRGRLVIKDVIMLAGAVVVLSDSARQYLFRLKRNERERRTASSRTKPTHPNRRQSY